jgi:class 3 adenylate cyclase
MTVQSPARSCPRCDAPVAADARFCANCGQALEAPTEQDQATHQRLTAAAPAPLIEKMRTTRITGERKPVTALFVDVVGSTALAERMDPEDWTAMMNQAFDLMSRAVFRYEGTIAQLQGDALVAFFGAPIAHEDDPERATLAALDMIEATAEFARELRQEHGIDFRIRAGINTGPVLVGNVGTDLRYEYTALGDAMNTAARMQAAAQPGTVLVTEATIRLTGDTFDVEDLGAVEVKGKSEPVHAFRVVGRKLAPGRHRGLERMGLESPMVGRDRPLARLLDLLAVARAGRGRLAFLVGEPGIGKSRLLAELRNAAPDVGWIEGRCVSYGRSVPYHLLIDLARQALSLPAAGSDDDLRAALDSATTHLLGADAGEATPYLASLMSLPLAEAEANVEKVDPGFLQGRYVAALHRVIRARAAERPLALVIEDIHWADEASIECIRQLLALVTTLPVLVVAALRAETDTPGWDLLVSARGAFGQALTEIQLEPLAEPETRQLVANLLEIESLPERVRALILARAEGNPFFVEEVVRMLIERGAIVAVEGGRWVATEGVTAVEIPTTLQSLLLARIDGLPDGAKRSLRVASVIGRQFPVRVLESVLNEVRP